MFQPPTPLSLWHPVAYSAHVSSPDDDGLFHAPFKYLLKEGWMWGGQCNSGVTSSSLRTGFYPGINTRGCESQGGGEASGRSPRTEGPRVGVEFLGTGRAASTCPPPDHIGICRSGERCKLPQQGGKAPENLKFGATWDLKSHFRNTKCIK